MKRRLQNTAPLLPLPVAVDLTRFEKNLLQIGFFGAHDTRMRHQSTRRIEQLVTRNGQRIKVSAEFRGSELFGLPSTSDRDKYLAFMRIAMEQRAQGGQLTNPIRFTGYRLLKELGFSCSGENYEDINTWGQRMADTTITSEQVIYLAARKKYANKTLHVFRSFTRIGEAASDDSNRVESYEVVLEDWLLDNLNNSYVVPEDFNAYRQLKRPTAKGIFGFLHLWFHASHGKAIEKDYSGLCLLLNIPAYQHASKIKETMGRSLDELVSIGYLSEWDVCSMMTKEGYKLVLAPGGKLLRVLALSYRNLTGREPQENQTDMELSQEQKIASDALVERGISPIKANSLVRSFDAGTIADKIEYTEYLVSQDRRRKIENPAGLLIYVIERDVTIPAGFVTNRQRRQLENLARQHDEAQGRELQKRLQYDEWIDARLEEETQRKYPGEALPKLVKNVLKQRLQSEPYLANMPKQHQEAIALQFIRQEIRNDGLPSFEEWCAHEDAQLSLF